jgi:hypothetical protein
MVTWLPHFGSGVNGIVTSRVPCITSYRKLKSDEFVITYILKFDSGIMYISHVL